MTGIHRVQKLFLVFVMAIMLIAAVPTTSLGKDRNGRKWRGRDNWDSSDWFRRNRNRKCRKFRNCHDARDGRWDGRGPSGDRVGNIFWRNRRNRDRDSRRWRDRDFEWRDRNFDRARVWRQRNR